MRRKAEQPTLDPAQDLELTIKPEWQASDFTITGPFESVQPIAEAVQALDAAKPVNVPVVPEKPATRPVRVPEAPVVTYELPTPRQKLSQWFADGKLRKFDRQFETNLYAEKQAQRRKAAIFLMASESGLLDVSHDSYKRQVNRLTKTGV
jgi:hypothetical protein